MPPKNFQPSANTFAPGGTPLPVSAVDPIQTLATDGAITALSGVVVITKGSAAAITLAVPDQDGQKLFIVSQSAFAHTITTVSPGYNNVSAYTVITMAPVAYDVVQLVSQGGIWWVTRPSFNSNALQSTQIVSADGALTIKNGLVLITKSASALAGTIAAPTAGVDDGAQLVIIATTAQAHVVTQGTVGFNAKGSSGTCTWAAAIGNGCTLVAYNGNWYVHPKTGVTVA